MSIGPFGKTGRFWRGNLHAHSTRSDGRLNVEALCRVYRDGNYDFLAVTDHFLQEYGYPITDATAFDGDGFITIPGAELHAGSISTGEPWHLVGVGLPHDFAPPAPGESGPELAARALRAGAFVAAAHPAWYGATAADILSLGPIHAVEAWNATSDDYNDRADSWTVLDQLLAEGGRHLACVADDTHSSGTRSDALRAWVWVKSESLEADAIVHALKGGDYYSSMGPQIHEIDRDDRHLVVRCSPAERVFVTGKGSAATAVRGDDLIEARLDIGAVRSPYCRVTVRDRCGRRAWSNPIWL